MRFETAGLHGTLVTTYHTWCYKPKDYNPMLLALQLPNYQEVFHPKYLRISYIFHKPNLQNYEIWGSSKFMQ